MSAPIIGATEERHADDTVAAANLALTDEELVFLTDPYHPRPVAR